MVKTVDKQSISDLIFQDLKGLIEIREIDQLGDVKTRFFKGLEHFKTYNPPTDKNVYMGLFSRLKAKGIKENCFHTNVLWADYDNMTLLEVQERILSAGLPYPSIFVNSGNGIHSYWVLEKNAREGVEDVLKAIAVSTKADTKAAEIARIMRMPGTNNVKDVPKACEVLEINDYRYPFEMFKNIFRITSKPSESVVIEELEASKMACIRLIAKGVGKGQRNFALGKITAYLKQQGISRKKAFEIANRWNQNNNPIKPDRELQDEFNRFWEGDYKYLGCKFTNPDLERVNKQLCPIGECEFHSANSLEIISESSLILDNYIFKPTVYPDMTGLDLAVYAIIMKADEGITRKHIAFITKRDDVDRGLIQTLKRLVSMGFVEIRKGIKKMGQQDRYFAVTRSNYGRGYTIINPLLNEVYLGNRITDNEYKLLTLLKSYSYGKAEVYPTRETLAVLMGLKENSIRKILNLLELKQYIKKSYKQLDNGKTKLIITLKF